MNEENIKEFFAQPKVATEFSDLAEITAEYLMERCTYHEGMSVAVFLGNLEPPSREEIPME